MSSNYEVSNVLGDRKEAVVTTSMSENKSSTNNVEKGTDKLADKILMDNITPFYSITRFSKNITTVCYRCNLQHIHTNIRILIFCTICLKHILSRHLWLLSFYTPRKHFIYHPINTMIINMKHLPYISGSLYFQYTLAF